VARQNFLAPAQGIQGFGIVIRAQHGKTAAQSLESNLVNLLRHSQIMYTFCTTSTQARTQTKALALHNNGNVLYVEEQSSRQNF
jgi:hypothetical protein